MSAQDPPIADAIQPRDLDLRPMPVLPQSSHGHADDEPKAIDRALVTQSAHVAAGLAVLGLGLLTGLGIDLSLVGAFCVGYAGFIWGQLLPGRHFARGLYRRSLDLAERLERGSWLARPRATWRLQRAACLIMLGDLEQAKTLMRGIERETLAPQARAVLDIDLAVLYCRMVAPDSALSVLDQIDPEMLPRRFRPFFHLARASAENLKDNFPAVLAEVAKVENESPPAEFAAACLILKALVKLEADGDPHAALVLSNEALDRLGRWHPVRPGILVTHARIALEATGAERECLSILERVFGHEPELGLSGQAELHYLLARCYRASSLLADARSHLARALKLPAPPRLRQRIEALAKEILPPPPAAAP